MPENRKVNPSGKGRNSVTVNVALSPKEGAKAPTARAYLFDQAGRLVSSEPATKSVTFKVNPQQDYRITVGPDLLQDGKAPANLAVQLVKAKAVSQDSIAALGSDVLNFHIFPPIWICWFPTCMNVHGTVRKLLNPGGTPPQYAPICSGTVQIFEVALDCTLDSFTVVELLTFKSRLLEKISGVHLAQDVSTRSAVARNKLSFAKSAAAMVSAESLTTRSVSDLAATIASLQGTQLKQFIIANKFNLWWFLCELIPDSAFCWQELTEVPIQSDGTFSSEICFWCPDDLPDLYFEVIQTINGSEIEISDPQIACSTYYGYDGSQSVDIVVDDPRAVACMPTNPGPEYLYVWPTAIGNIDLGQIDGLETLAGTGLLPTNTPWGGTLCLQMQFHPDLQANNIKYYRWSYKFDDESDFTQIHATVTHQYKTIVPLGGGGFEIVLNPVTLGPQTGTPNLFEIPDASLQWSIINDPADRPFAYFDSTEAVLPRKSGGCTLMLEMFDGSGNFVPCNNTRGSSTLGDQAGDPGGAGAFTYILPELPPNPPNHYTNAPTPNITDHGRLIFRIQVDNNNTVAELPGVSTPLGSTDTDPCGVLHYTHLSDNVDLSYVAFHPNNYLDWDLTISKGVTGVVASIPPPPGPPAPSNHTSSGSPGSPAHYMNSAGSLLGTCAQAAFAVNLYCAARAESGYGRQSQYDSSATIAFALLHP